MIIIFDTFGLKTHTKNIENNFLKILPFLFNKKLKKEEKRARIV
jgi:hypothetical protein